MRVTNEMVEAFCRVYWSGDWPYERTEADRELSNLLRSKVRAGLDQALSHAAGQEGRDETMVEIFPGLPKLPRWLFDYAGDISRYMKKHHPGQWIIDGIESRGYTAPPTTSAEVGRGGEQCRAASGDREALAKRLRELICEYWDLAYDEGVDKRKSDTPAGDANRVANEIETIIRALSRGVPEDVAQAVYWLKHAMGTGGPAKAATVQIAYGHAYAIVKHLYAAMAASSGRQGD